MSDLIASAEPSTYKVVLVFHLKPGTADEELRRSGKPESFPNRLARRPGHLAMELVKIDEDTTMSVQTWKTQSDWWAALEATKNTQVDSDNRETILVSRDFFGGTVIRSNLVVA